MPAYARYRKSERRPCAPTAPRSGRLNAATSSLEYRSDKNDALQGNVRDGHDPGNVIEEAHLEALAGCLPSRETRYADAATHLNSAAGSFGALGQAVEAARCLRAVANVTVYQDAAQALPILAQASAVFRNLQLPLDLALADHIEALAYTYLSNRYEEALALQHRCAETFDSLGAPFFAAWCKADSGVLGLELNFAMKRPSQT